jgi:hypothetical protein
MAKVALLFFASFYCFYWTKALANVEKSGQFVKTV